MIICSCNVFSDHEVRSAVVVGAPPLTTGELFRYLGCRAQCGRCAWSIKAIMHEHAVAEYEPHITAPKSDAKRLDFHAEKLRPDRNALGSAMLASCGQGRTDPGDQGQRNSRVVDQLRRASKMRHKLSGNNQGHLKGKSSCG